MTLMELYVSNDSDPFDVEQGFCLNGGGDGNLIVHAP